MSGGLSTNYQFREATLNDHENKHKKPLQPEGRTILALNTTPSLKGTGSFTAIDPNISAAKMDERIQTYLVSAIIEIIMCVTLNRGKTTLQGSRATSGMQAAHASLAPSTFDTFTSDLIRKIIEDGLTPRKTLPFVEKRMNLSSEETTLLNLYHTNSNFVRTFIVDHLPPDGVHSILSGSRYHWNNNATFENPDASNQFDSQMERRIKPLLKELQNKRLQNGASAEETTGELVAWFVKDYTQSIANLNEKLTSLDEAYHYFQEMRHFEQNFLPDGPNLAEFAEYVNHAAQFLCCYTDLLTKKEGCPSTKVLKWVRNDIKFIKKLVHRATVENIPLEMLMNDFLTHSKHLASPMEFPYASMKAKHESFLEEAQIQLQAVEAYTAPCAIPSLQRLFFGVMDQGVRRNPTPQELRKQVYELCAPATPVKQKIAKRLAIRPIPIPGLFGGPLPNPKRQKT